MKKLFTFAILGVLVAAPAFGQMTLVEDFSTYTDGDSLKLVGGWDNTRNSSFQPSLWDTENLLVTTDSNGVNLLALSDRDATTSHGGDLQLGVTGAAYDIPDIANLGTIYMKLRLDDNVNTAIATNGRQEDFCDDNATTACQQVHNWGDQATINRFELPGKKLAGQGPVYKFDARDGTGYVESPTSTYSSETWYEYWIQVDVSNKLANYYMRELGDASAPVAMLDAGGSADWGFRNLTYSSITTLKFNISPAPVWNCDNVPGGVDDPAVDNCTYTEMLIAEIGVNDSAWTLETVGDYVPPIADPCPARGAFGDFNCDTTVGLLDLDILGQNWGSIGLDPATSYQLGDANGDGEVGLLDLDKLGQNWGQSTPVPEPATLGLLAIGSIMAIRRR